MFDLTGKVALVTGSSRGIGRQAALALAEAGASVFIHYVSKEDRAKEAAAIVQEQCPGRLAGVVRQDLAAPDCAQKLFDRTGPVDILILNASVQYRNPWNRITPEQFEEQVNCNFRASFVLVQAYAPSMLERHWGRIVTVGSVQETRPHKDMLIYAATKAAQTSMAKNLARQFAKDNVTVNNLAPGVIATDRNAEAAADTAYHNQVLAGIPSGRIALPQELKGAVRFLCSEEAAYVTGQSLFVDGGMGV